MADERAKTPRVRLFLALDLPEALRVGIADWSREELGDAALRPVSRESLHITLAFLGSRPEREVAPLGQILAETEAAAPLAQLGDPLARPSRKRARLFALPVASSDAIGLQAALEEKLVSAGLHKPEGRPFWPHVTVARVKSRGGRPERVAKQPGKLPKGLLTPVRCVRVTLYRSELQPLGARYTPLAQVELSEDGRQ